MYYVECPYCNEDNEIDYFESDSFDMECDHCGEEFEVIVEYDPSFSSNKIDYHTCLDCGKEFRYEGSRLPQPKKYEHLNKEDYEKICYQCFIKAYFDELDSKGSDNKDV